MRDTKSDFGRFKATQKLTANVEPRLHTASIKSLRSDDCCLTSELSFIEREESNNFHSLLFDDIFDFSMDGTGEEDTSAVDNLLTNDLYLSSLEAVKREDSSSFLDSRNSVTRSSNLGVMQPDKEMQVLIKRYLFDDADQYAGNIPSETPIRTSTRILPAIEDKYGTNLKVVNTSEVKEQFSTVNGQPHDRTAAKAACIRSDCSEDTVVPVSLVNDEQPMQKFVDVKIHDQSLKTPILDPGKEITTGPSININQRKSVGMNLRKRSANSATSVASESEDDDYDEDNSDRDDDYGKLICGFSNLVLSVSNIR